MSDNPTPDHDHLVPRDLWLAVVADADKYRAEAEAAQKEGN
jgi:hypothetical protein